MNKILCAKVTKYKLFVTIIIHRFFQTATGSLILLFLLTATNFLCIQVQVRTSSTATFSNCSHLLSTFTRFFSFSKKINIIGLLNTYIMPYSYHKQQLNQKYLSQCELFRNLTLRSNFFSSINSIKFQTICYVR